MMESIDKIEQFFEGLEAEIEPASILNEESLRQTLQQPSLTSATKGFQEACLGLQQLANDWGIDVELACRSKSDPEDASGQSSAAIGATKEKSLA